MGLVPVMFKLERKSMLPILTVTGTCRILPMVDSMLIMKAVQMIEFAQNQFKGKLMELMGHEHEVQPENGMMAIRFYIIFPNDAELYKAIASFQKGLGWFPNSFFMLKYLLYLKFDILLYL